MEAVPLSDGKSDDQMAYALKAKGSETMYDDVTSSRGAETRRINKIDDQMAYASKAKGSEILFDGASSGEKTGEEHLGKSDVSLIRELGREQQLRRKAQENLTKQFDKGLKHDHLLWQIRRIHNRSLLCCANYRRGCQNYEEEEKEFAVCAQCRMVKYCSKTCQVEHWPDHKLGCIPVRRPVGSKEWWAVMAPGTKPCYGVVEPLNQNLKPEHNNP